MRSVSGAGADRLPGEPACGARASEEPASYAENPEARQRRNRPNAVNPREPVDLDCKFSLTAWTIYLV